MPAAPTWNHKYTIRYNNENNELCLVKLSSKTDNGDEVILDADEAAVSISYPNSAEDKFSPIRGSEFVLRFQVNDGDPIDLDTFIGPDDEWKVDYYKADMSVTNWQGFLVQDEHSRDMQDPPYVLELRAVDGMAWSKDKPLTKEDGTDFTGLNFIIDYIGAILWQINPYLKLVTHVNVFNIAHDDRDIAPENDPWAQTKVQARSFQNSATSFLDQYAVLERTLISWGCVLFQWNGGWHIVDLWDMMKGQTSYTIYGYNLASPTDAHVRIIEGSAINETYEGKIAPYANPTWGGPIHPTNEDQLIGLKFANKSVRLTYNYTPWPELPLNNKFERGTFLPLLSDATHTALTVADWINGRVSSVSGIMWPLNPFIGAAHATAYSYRTFDSYGKEISREVVMPLPTTGLYPTSDQDWLRSEGIPVSAGDKVSVSFGWRLNVNWASIDTPIPVWVYVIDEAGTTFYGLTQHDASNEHGLWKTNDLGGIYAENPSGDYTVVNAWSCDSQPIPVNGTLYIVFAGMRTVTSGQNGYWTDFRFDYHPYAAGGYSQVNGEYNLIAQNQEYKQKADIEIFQADSTHGVLQGALYRFTNVPTDHYVLSNPVWYRYGYSAIESRRFIEIQALKRFWATYRAMKKIEGSFSGLIFFQATELPLGIITLLFPEWMGEGKRYMITSMEQDHKTADSKLTMIETGSESDAIVPDTNTYGFIFETT